MFFPSAPLGWFAKMDARLADRLLRNGNTVAELGKCPSYALRVLGMGGDSSALPRE